LPQWRTLDAGLSWSLSILMAAAAAAKGTNSYFEFFKILFLHLLRW
jgi:hypothetical protein